MLQHLHSIRGAISRLMLTLFGVLWLGLVVQAFALADGQADHDRDCCCEEGEHGCAWGYTPLEQAPCPVMQALASDPSLQGLTGGERPFAQAASLPGGVVYFASADRRLTSLRPATVHTPRSHPALRFRVLLI